MNRLFACTILCMILFSPGTSVSSQDIDRVDKIAMIKEKESANKQLEQQVEQNKKEISRLLNTLVTIKKKKSSVLTRVFQKKKYQKPGLITEPIPTDSILIDIEADSILAAPELKPLKQERKKKLFGIF